MDSVTLRKTHFKLGDFNNPYTTSTMDQNNNIENKRSVSIASLDYDVKNDLRKSHFIFGNSEPNYTTMSKSEFYNKSNIQTTNPFYSGANAKSIEKALRSHNYILGNDKPEYKSETGAKYISPIEQLSSNNNSQFTKIQPEKKISTYELQKSHYVFGNNSDPWITTQQMCYNPKNLEVKRITKDLMKTNFVFGEDKPDFKSVNQNTFIPHKLEKGNENKELSKDLRSIIINLL
jgi:hypothetical protein